MIKRRLEPGHTPRHTPDVIPAKAGIHLAPCANFKTGTLGKGCHPQGGGEGADFQELAP